MRMRMMKRQGKVKEYDGFGANAALVPVAMMQWKRRLSMAVLLPLQPLIRLQVNSSAWQCVDIGNH